MIENVTFKNDVLRFFTANIYHIAHDVPEHMSVNVICEFRKLKV